MRLLTIGLTLALLLGTRATAEEPRPIGSQRELFVDHYLIQDLKNARLVLARPIDRGPVMTLDRPWEGLFAGYFTVLRTATSTGCTTAGTVTSWIRRR